MSYDTIIYEVDPASKVATVTLNRPDVLNAFNRAMCEDVREVWHEIKSDVRVNAVVLDQQTARRHIRSQTTTATIPPSATTVASSAGP